MPSAWQNSFYTLDVNWGLLSDTVSAGIPSIRNTRFTNSSAVSLAEGSLGRATKCTALEKQSIIVRIVSLPLDKGNLVTKSKAMWEGRALGADRGDLQVVDELPPLWHTRYRP